MSLQETLPGVEPRLGNQESNEPAQEYKEVRAWQAAAVEATAGMLAWRFALVQDIGIAKLAQGQQVYSGSRELDVFNRFVESAKEHGIDRELASTTIGAIMLESRRVQRGLPQENGALVADCDPQKLLAACRQEIDETDLQLAELLGHCLQGTRKRRALATQLGLAGYSGQEETELIAGFAGVAAANGVSEVFSRRIITPYVSSPRLSHPAGASR